MIRAAALSAVLGPVRAAGRTVVFTNGCYDLLHAGHLSLLESAAMQGDVLIVGLNDDGSVRRLKGSSRPFVPFPERAELLSGLEVVDWIVGFAEETPARLIEAVQPDVLVKGGDWSSAAVVGRELVEARGGRVVRIPLLEGRSTTAIAERIRGRRDP